MRITSAWVVTLLLAGAAAATYAVGGRAPLAPSTADPGFGADDGPIVLALDVVASLCSTIPDQACLSYGGAAPGPTFVFHVGDEVEIAVTNRIPETIAPLALDAALKARLASASVSLHVHGMDLAAEMDGLAPHPGTQFVDSSVAPGGSFVYAYHPLHAGPWHYHDHVLGPDGSEGQERGLFGSILVLEAGDEPDTVLDHHILDSGVNAGHGLTHQGATGDHVRILVNGLGNFVWTVKLLAPGGATLAQVSVGPGVSEEFDIPSAASGTYRLRATSIYTPATYNSDLVFA